jgi:hypothetical protein
VEKAAGHKQGNFLHLLRSFFVDVWSISGMIYCWCCCCYYCFFFGRRWSSVFMNLS